MTLLDVVSLALAAVGLAFGILGVVLSFSSRNVNAKSNTVLDRVLDRVVAVSDQGVGLTSKALDLVGGLLSGPSETLRPSENPELGDGALARSATVEPAALQNPDSVQKAALFAVARNNATQLLFRVRLRNLSSHTMEAPSLSAFADLVRARTSENNVTAHVLAQVAAFMESDRPSADYSLEELEELGFRSAGLLTVYNSPGPLDDMLPMPSA
ncbi:MAG: hypothetical protein WC971_08135 [Coriobacteriia bacterium]